MLKTIVGQPELVLLTSHTLSFLNLKFRLGEEPPENYSYKQNMHFKMCFKKKDIKYILELCILIIVA
jgi:hypothetical protein